MVHNKLQSSPRRKRSAGPEMVPPAENPPKGERRMANEAGHTERTKTKRQNVPGGRVRVCLLA